MTATGQSGPKRDLRVTSVHPSISDIILRRRDTTLWAMCGRLQVGKENLHVAGLVGAAMMGWTAPHSHVTGWWDINSRQQRGGGYGYQGDWA